MFQIQTLTGWIRVIWPRADHEAIELVRSTAIALFLKIIAGGLVFIFSVVLARFLGAEGTGIYFLALTMTTVAAVLGRVGLDNALLRFVSAHAAMQDWRQIEEVFIRCVRVTLLGAGATGLALFLCADVLSEQVFSTPNLAGVLRWMVLGVVPLALLTLHAQGLQGMRKFREALFVLNVAVPLVSLPLLFLMAPSFGVIGAVWAYVIATVGTLAIGIWRWRSAIPREPSIRSESWSSELFASSIPLFWTSVFQLTILWVPIVLLGTWATMKDVGLYGAATRVVVLITMIVMSVNSVLAPTFSSLFRLGDIAALKRVSRLSATLTTVAVAPIITFVMLWPNALMSIFGNEFADGGTLLVILAMGQLFNVLTGSVGHLLMMCGHERFVRNNVIGCALLNFVCSALLIPRFGAIGAATAVAVTVIAENVSAAIYAWFKLGVLSVPAIGSR